MHVSFDESSHSKEEDVTFCDDDNLVEVPIEGNINDEHVE